jgi:hypothetical protein
MTDAKQPNEVPPLPSSSTSYIGTAYMDEEGTIELRLKVESEGMIGEGVLTYPKYHPDYMSILSHLNGLKPGEHKPVRPWTQANK